MMGESDAISGIDQLFGGLLEAAPDAMIVVDTVGIRFVNSQAERLFGYSRDELLGKPVELLVPIRHREIHPKHRHHFGANLKTRPMGADLDLCACRKDGSEFPAEISLAPLETAEGLLVTAAIRDITARRRAEELLQSSLREKETLLKEVHHRVKNNLQVISSLLSLQSHAIEDESVRSIFALSQARIQSIALVHEKLYQSKNLSHIDFGDYLRTLVVYLFRTQNVGERGICHQIDGGGVLLPVDLAAPLGLIVNELVLNSLKHAFPGTSGGTIGIQIVGQPHGGLELTVRDDGIGFTEESLQSETSLGIELVQALARQIDAEVEWSGSEGAHFRFRLSHLDPSSREVG